MMDAITLFHRSAAAFVARVEVVRPDQWGDPTPCEEWTVRDLVNHVTYENAWTVPLLDGLTVAEVGTKLDGDLLGDDPIKAAAGAAAAAIDAFDASIGAGTMVDTSHGPMPAEEYARQMAAENLIHGWDLAAATEGDVSLDADLVADLTEWFVDREEQFRSSGGIDSRGPMTGDPGDDLLAMFGRDSDWSPPD